MGRSGGLFVRSWWSCRWGQYCHQLLLRKGLGEFHSAQLCRDVTCWTGTAVPWRHWLAGTAVPWRHILDRHSCVVTSQICRDVTGWPAQLCRDVTDWPAQLCRDVTCWTGTAVPWRHMWCGWRGLLVILDWLRVNTILQHPALVVVCAQAELALLVRVHCTVVHAEAPVGCHASAAL